MALSQAFDLQCKDLHEKIWILTFDVPGEKVNTLSQAVMAEFEQVIEELKVLIFKKDIRACILVSGKNKQFIAGADIKMIQACNTEADAQTLSQKGHHLSNAWEDLPILTIAAVDGPALGGGLELCLASSLIVASSEPNIKLGLPEVQLGILPGMGATARLPRRVGLFAALDLLLSGKQISAKAAQKMGLVDKILPKENFLDNVCQFAKKRLSGKDNSGSDGLLSHFFNFSNPLLEAVMRRVVLQKARSEVLKKTHGFYPAPLEILNLLEKTHQNKGVKVKGTDRSRKLELEAKAFGKLVCTDVSKKLIRVFFLNEATKKPPQTEVSELVRVPTVVSVLGAGVMGGPLAAVLAEKGFHVKLKDINPVAIENGLKLASHYLRKKVLRKKGSPRELANQIARITPASDYSNFSKVDLVIEAVAENFQIKSSVLKELEQNVRPDALIASNTSALSITSLQNCLTKNPENFAGMHFFNPVPKMPLVEIIPGPKTSDRTIRSIWESVRKMGKVAIIVKDSPGFLVNRLLLPYANEAVLMMQEGVNPLQIDKALCQFGFPMGPVELIDEVGLDVGSKVGHLLKEAFPENILLSTIPDKLIELKRLGKKTNAGIYDYLAKGKTFNPQLLAQCNISVEPLKLDSEVMTQRCLMIMINEAFRLLSEKVIRSASDLDIGMIFGAGFPPFRGGLFAYSLSLGLETIWSKLGTFHDTLGPRFKPAPLLEELHRTGKSLSSIASI